MSVAHICERPESLALMPYQKLVLSLGDIAETIMGDPDDCEMAHDALKLVQAELLRRYV